MAIVLPTIVEMFGDHPNGALNIVLPPITETYVAGLATPSYAIMSLQLPPLAYDAYGTTGEIGQMALTLAPMTDMLADHPYGMLNIVLAPITDALDAHEGPHFASMASSAFDSDFMTPLNYHYVVMNSVGTVTASFTISVLHQASMYSTASETATLITKSTRIASMISFAYATATSGVPAGEMQTWVVNMDQEGFGSTSYSNFDFNSFMRIGDKFYGASSTGLHLLDGDNDNGLPIRASISFGVLDFGTDVKKTIQECYLGMSAEGNLFVKVIANGQSFIYQTRSYSDELMQQRVTFGKGLRTNYMTLELYNEDGDDFELDTVKFVVADLTRKI